MRVNLPSDYELDEIAHNVEASAFLKQLTPRNIAYMAKEILEYHELISKLRKALDLHDN